MDLSGINLREKAEKIVNSVAMACEAGTSKLLSVHLSDNDLQLSTQDYIIKKLAIETSELHRASIIHMEEYEKHALEFKGATDNKIHQYVH